ncbi:hypothetical protein MSAN_02044200 [Mycena sanguinolenta]|uniref:Uncharacterized protein n=1 Tax=Mycena sanguinolenta TaxID=230812 RepID=A0A8H6XK06_9AGAR|nr:hypothetical protein MSAN_02044200 [Mycena sanguinolenta]
MARMGRSKPSAHATRNPGKRVQLSRRRLGLSGAERVNAAIKTLESRQRKHDYEEAIDQFFLYRDVEISRIAKAHGKSERVVRNLLCHKTQYKTQRKKTLRNAILHDRALKAKESGESKQLGDYQEELQEDVDEGIADVTRESLGEEEYKRLMDQLEDHRKTKKRGVRMTAKAAATDARQTAVRVGEELIDLHERTGVRAFAVFSRGNGDDAALPHYVESGGAISFFPDELRIPSVEALRRFERFACTCDNGGEEKNDINMVRSFVAKVVQDGLREIKNNGTLHMEYANYDSAIRAELGVEMKGWPSDIPVERAANMNVESARRIRDGFKSGAIHWAWIPKAERDALIAGLNTERAAGNGSLRKRAERSDKGVLRGPRKPAATSTPSTTTQAAATLAPGCGSALGNTTAVGNATATPVATAVPVAAAMPITTAATVTPENAAAPSQHSVASVEHLLSLPTYAFNPNLHVDIDLDALEREMAALGYLSPPPSTQAADGPTPDDGPIGIRLPPPPSSPSRTPLAPSSTVNTAVGSKRPSTAAAGGEPVKKKRKVRKDAGHKRRAENEGLRVVQEKKPRKKRSDAGRPPAPVLDFFSVRRTIPPAVPYVSFHTVSMRRTYAQYDYDYDYDYADDLMSANKVIYK